jgi:hypothetical protein
MLWRGVPQATTFFGKGSFWTPSRSFAIKFIAWRDQRVPADAPHVLYELDADVGDRYDFPTLPFIESARVATRVDQFAALGFRWITFHEEPWLGITTRQFVYLGNEPLPARRSVAGDAEASRLTST